MLPSFAPARSRSFRLVWYSSLAAAGALWMGRVATGWLALETSGGALGVAGVFAARMLPSLLLGLAAGTVADRFDRRRLLMAVAVAGALLAVVLGILVASGSVTYWEVVAFAFLTGCVGVADTPARQALVVDTVERAAAPNAIALNAVASRLFGAVGAFLGGLIIPTLGVAGCFYAVAAGLLIGMALLAAIGKVPGAVKPATVHPPFTRAMADAGRLIREIPTVRTLVLAAMACEIFGFSYMTVVPTFARDVLRTGAEGYGSLTAAGGIGATIAVVLLACLPAGIRREPLLAAVYLAYGAGLIGLAASPTFVVAVGAMLMIGACQSSFDLLQQTLVQLAVPDDKRGRAVGIWSFSTGTAPLGHLEVGALAAEAGAPMALLANGVLVMLGALTLVAQAPSFRIQRTGDVFTTEAQRRHRGHREKN